MSDLATNEVMKAVREFRLDEVIGWDLAVAALFTGASLWVSTGLNQPDRLIAAAPAALGLLGVIVGAVLAALTILGALMQPELLRNLQAIDKKPGRYLAPFVFTALIGIAGMLVGLTLATLTTDDTPWLVAALGAATAGLCVWALASLVRCLGMVLQFVELLQESAVAGDVTRLSDKRKTS